MSQRFMHHAGVDASMRAFRSEALRLQVSATGRSLSDAARQGTGGCSRCNDRCARLFRIAALDEDARYACCDRGGLMGLPMAAVGLLGAGVSAFGQYESGQANSAAAAYQAQVAANNAKIAMQNATWESQAGETES